MTISPADMAYEVLVRSWRSMTITELSRAIRALCAATIDSPQLEAALSADARFTSDGAGLYGLEEFRWRTPGDFAYTDPASIARAGA